MPAPADGTPPLADRPPPTPPAERILRGLAYFTRILAADGIAIGPDRAARYARALGEIDLAARDEIFWTGFTTLCSRRDELAAYARAFASAWNPALGAFETGGGGNIRIALADPPPLDGALSAIVSDDGERIRHVPYSAVAFERDKDFAAYTADDFARYQRALITLRFGTPPRIARRLARAPRGRLDLRATLRRSVALGGEPLDPAMRAKTDKPRRIVALCDVSGSMEPYARAFLAFVHAGVVSGLPFEAFALGTRAVRLTGALRSRDPDRALADVAALVKDFGSGTRLGASLQTFVERYGARGMARGAIVMIVSDGWDRGDTAILHAQMARLARLADRIVWVNPRRAVAGYEPLAIGMATALPFVDAFLSGNTFHALTEVVEAMFVAGSMRRLGKRRSVT